MGSTLALSFKVVWPTSTYSKVLITVSTRVRYSKTVNQSVNHVTKSSITWQSDQSKPAKRRGCGFMNGRTEEQLNHGERRHEPVTLSFLCFRVSWWWRYDDDDDDDDGSDDDEDDGADDDEKEDSSGDSFNLDYFHGSVGSVGHNIDCCTKIVCMDNNSHSQ